MAVTADVVDAKLNGIDIKTLPIASTVINQEEVKHLKFVNSDELLDRIPSESHCIIVAKTTQRKIRRAKIS